MKSHHLNVVLQKELHFSEGEKFMVGKSKGGGHDDTGNLKFCVDFSLIKNLHFHVIPKCC